MYKYFILFLLIPISSFAQIDDFLDSNGELKTASQLGNIVVGVTNIRSKSYLDTYIHQRMVDLANAVQFRTYNDNDYSTLASALTEANEDSVALSITKRHSVTTNTSLSGTYILDLRDPRGKFSITSGDTLTLDVPFYPQIVDHQVFEGAGVVKFGEQVKYVTPEMWGAVGDQSTEDSLAFQRMINSLVASDDAARHQIVILSRRYKVSGQLAWSGNFHLKFHGVGLGAGRHQDLNSYTGPLIVATSLDTNTSLFKFNGNLGNTSVQFKNFRIDGPTPGTSATGDIIEAYNLKILDIENMVFYQAADNVINVDGSNGKIAALVIRNSNFVGNSGAYKGIAIEDSMGIQAFRIKDVNIGTSWSQGIKHRGNTTLPFTWDHLVVTDTGADGVYIEEKGDIFITSSTFENAAQSDTTKSELRIIGPNSGTTTLKIANSYFAGATGDSSLLVLDDVSRASITGSYFDVSNTASSTYCVNIKGGNDIVFVGNNTGNGAGGAIVIEPDTADALPVRLNISGNLIGSAGIAIQFRNFGATDSLAWSVLGPNILSSGSGTAQIGNTSKIDETTLVYNAYHSGNPEVSGYPYLDGDFINTGRLFTGGYAPQTNVEVGFSGSGSTNIYYNLTDGSLNQKLWEWRHNDGQLSLKALQDNQAADQSAIDIWRNGITIDSLKIGANAAVSAGGTNTNGVGSFTADSLFQDATKITAPAFVAEKEYQDNMPTIDEAHKYFMKNKELPTMGEERKKFLNLGRMNMQLTETVEVQLLYIKKLHDELRVLKNIVVDELAARRRDVRE